MSLSRRGFLRTVAGGLALGALGAFPAGALADEQSASPGMVRLGAPPGLQAARAYLLDVARSCVVNRGNGSVMAPGAGGDYAAGDQTWIRPSDFYHDCFSRDSFWVLAALQSRALLDVVRQRFHIDQAGHVDGHVATSLRLDGAVPEGRDRDDESTLLDVLREYEYALLGGTPDLDSLGRSLQYIQAHLQSGFYVTVGDASTGAFHYWADTLRTPNPQAIAYNQGLACVALEALDRMGLPVRVDLKAAARRTYASMAGTADDAVMPQRLHSAALDVSALAGDALSLYYFNSQLLPDARVQATFDRWTGSGAVYAGGFLGFRVLTNFDGSYLSHSEFVGPESIPGNYHNGGSWLLYDALALYSAARHGIAKAADLLMQRV